MLALQDLEDFASQHIADRPNLENFFMVAQEDEYVNYMQDVVNPNDMMTLVVVLPTFDSRISDEDDRKMGNNLYFMIVKKTDNKAGYDEKIEIFKKTQTEMNELLKKITELAYSDQNNCLFREIELPTLRIDPVTNYHGTNGWEMEFVTETKIV